MRYRRVTVLRGGDEVEEWRRCGQRRADLSSVTDVEDDDDCQVT